MVKVNIDSLVELIRAARARPAMYFGAPDPDRAHLWLFGLRAGVSLGGLQWPDAHHAEVLKKRRLRRSAAGEVYELRRRGWSDERIVDELLLVEEEIWLRAKDAG